MPSWAALGRLLGALRRLLAPHGHFLGAPGARLVLSWASLGWSVASPEWVLPSRDPPGLDFWRFLDVPSWVVEGISQLMLRCPCGAPTGVTLSRSHEGFSIHVCHLVQHPWVV